MPGITWPGLLTEAASSPEFWSADRPAQLESVSKWSRTGEWWGLRRRSSGLPSADSKCKTRRSRPWRRTQAIFCAGVFSAELLVAGLCPCDARNAAPADRSDVELGTMAGSLAEVQTGPSSSGQKDARTSDSELCASQHPLLLSRYKWRPSWRVAGVDYCVGHTADTILKDPATISIEGVSVDTSNHIVTLLGSNVAVDGYDFSLDGGWGVRVKGANNSIVNSNFVVGSNDLLPIVGTPEATQLHIAHCTIDGAEHDPGPWGTMVAYSGSGLTIEYSWLKNSGGDMIQQIGGAGSIVIEHNLIQDGGLSPGTHGDYTQLEGGPFTVAINYNTTLQSRGTTQGLMTEYVAEGEIGHNTMIGTVSYFVSVDLSSIRTTFTVHDNYFDARGFGFAYPSRNTGTPNDSSPKSIFTNNVNMRTGVVLQDAVRR